MSKSRTKYRISCPNYGTTGHSTHVATSAKMTLEKAQMDAAAQDRYYEHVSKSHNGSMYSYYQSEIGWRVESRTITEWETVT